MLPRRRAWVSPSSGAELTESQKLQARISLITNRLSDAQGNLALTAGTAANSLKGMWGRIEDLQEQIGTAMLPIVVKALEGFQQGIEALKLAWEKSGLAANAAAVGVVGDASKQVETISWLQKAVDFLADAWDTIKLKSLDAMHSMVHAAIQVVNTMSEVGSFLGPFVGTASNDVMKAADKATMALGTILREIDKLHAAEAAKPPTRNVVNEFLQQAKDNIEQARDTLAAQKPLDVTNIKPNAADAMKPNGAPQYASAMAMNSKEATNTLLRSSFGNGGGAADRTAKNTGEMKETMKEILQYFRSKKATHTPEDLGLIEI